ncbi:phosphatidylinositol N-acetylglucosaminyltransferase subunit P [Pieris brassicae]|uniref:phosphatidylinositol N-acetylglucosaminyltransferase subunit P n=1 Tax=Pieris brassicae TaxID=7116 RepID=UPI001E65FBF7|nr:phosphatidylinositol N-acetylglucosaminyltransferase subunit P [Pieris brassicae]XP_045519045.1 phosphatidylinositol N-acetylglucosaminyltransferase subunit P [Pieris brassicae]XP_045519046.1 phosphatidylinositol N-acetylglucosaminyltransferase subunit P [Pieris brassicae]
MPEHTPAPSPARSVYGFSMYLFSKTVLALYLIWAIVPNEYFHYMYIYYIPQKFWSTAVPIQCLVALTLFAFLIYPSSNLMLAFTCDSINSIWDKFSCKSNEINNYQRSIQPVCICKTNEKCKKIYFSTTPKDLDENTVPQLYDLDIRYVCKKLYLNRYKNI